MPNYTPNLNLKKPLQEEFYNVDVFNENADKIDAEMAKKANITHKHDGSTGNSSKITATEIAAGAADDAAIGNRTITDTTALAGTATTLTTLLGRIGNMIKSITGKSNWYTAPITTIEALNSNKAPNVHSSSATTYGISTATTYGHAMASNATPLVAGTAAVGTDNGKFARENHVHPAQTSVTGSSGSCTGNAATATTATSATTLTTARTIALSGKVTGTATSFDGSSNISINTTAVTANDSDTVDGKHASDFAPIHPTGVFFVGGDASTFYPIIFSGNNSYNAYSNKLVIKRHVHQDGANFGSTWLEAEWSAGEWGGNGRYSLVKNYHVNNVHVAYFDIAVNDRAFVVWLKGQRTYYWGGSLGVSLYDYNAVASKTLTSQTFTSKTTVGNTDGYFYNGVLLATVNSNVASASKVLDATFAGYAFTFNWQGKSGQPAYVLGGENRDIYAYDPGNFDVAKVGGYTAQQLMTSGNISILTGKVAHGGTLPLPSGYTEDKCKWMVSVSSHTVDDDDTIQCYTSAAVLNTANAGRVVTCYTAQRGGGTANYMIIGVK